MTPEQTLWQSVIFQAAIDATSNIPDEPEEPEFGASDREWKRYSGRVRARVYAQRVRDDADAWIRGAGKDFRTVCALAGVDPDFISNAYANGRINRDALKNANASEDAA